MTEFVFECGAVSEKPVTDKKNGSRRYVCPEHGRTCRVKTRVVECIEKGCEKLAVSSPRGTLKVRCELHREIYAKDTIAKYKKKRPVAERDKKREIDIPTQRMATLLDREYPEPMVHPVYGRTRAGVGFEGEALPTRAG